MKIFTLISVVLAVLICSSCQKDDSEKVGERIRLKKMADNVGMERADVFSYDSNGNLTQIQMEGSTSKTTIEYDSKNQPIKVIGSDNYVHTIEWNSSGFVVTSGDKSNSEVDSYILDSNGQVKSRIDKYIETSHTSTYNYSFNWIKADSLVMLGTSRNAFYNLSKTNSCFKGVNIALMQVLELAANLEMVDYQNLYCPAIYKGNDFSAKITYEVNDQNYPTKAIMLQYGDSEPWYTYYEYETY